MYIPNLTHFQHLYVENELVGLTIFALTSWKINRAQKSISTQKRDDMGTSVQNLKLKMCYKDMLFLFSMSIFNSVKFKLRRVLWLKLKLTQVKFLKYPNTMKPTYMIPEFKLAYRDRSGKRSNR